MNRLFQSIVIYILISFSMSQGHSQDGSAKPLKAILIELEERYDIRFSFENKIVEGINIASLESSLTLEEALEKLRKLTSLNFRTLSERFIAIYKSEIEAFAGIIQQLDEVVIKNYLTKGLSKTITGSINFNTPSYSIFPGLIEPDVLQIVQKLPGIVSVEEKISNINVRGGTNDQNLILYEGIRMYQSGHFFGLISAFNPYLTETVNINKNGTSAKFGDGVSGLFSISAPDKISQKSNGGLGINMLSVDGFSRIPLSQKTELQISARRSYTDLFKSSTFKSYFDRIFRDSELNIVNEASGELSVDDRFLFYDLNAKFLYDINKSSKLRINLLNLYNNLDYNQIFTTNSNTIVERENSLKQISYGIGATYSKSWNNGIQTSIQAYFSNYDLDAKNQSISTAQQLVQENEVEDYGIRIDASKQLNNNYKIIAGYQFNEVGVSNLEDVINPNFRSFIKEVIRTHSIFSELEWYSTSKNTFVRIGARGSYFEKLKKTIIEPRLVVDQKLLNDFRLEIIGELKSQSLTQIIDLQQDFFGIEKRRWQLANENDVPVIRSQQASIGLSYNKNGWLVSTEAYYKNVDDITARSQGFQNQFQFIDDLGSYSVLGIDFLINKRFNSFSTWLGYTYSTNNYSFENINDGKEFANTLDLRHVANFSLTYDVNNLKIGLGFNWHSGRAYTSPREAQVDNNTSIEFDAPNGSRLPDYLRADISALYNFNLSDDIRAEIGASIWNVLDKNNILNRFYSLDNNNSIVEVNNRSLRFTPNFSFRVNF